MVILFSVIKKIFKKNPFILFIYEGMFQRPIVNLFNKSYKKKVLFSYSTYHFSKKKYLGHSNYQESQIIASIFDELGYQIDVVNNNRAFKGGYSSYDIIFGEGLPIYDAIKSNTNAKIIYYGTGSHPWHCASSSLKRVVDYYKSRQYLAINSTRIPDMTWGLAASTADAVICIGNEITRQTFLQNGAVEVLTVDPTFHQRNDALKIAKSKSFNNCRNSMLWFGSYGLLHKGLDLAVEAFSQRPDWTLHICGYTPAEKKFLETLNLTSNIIIHGFINVFSDEFKELAQQCGFVILPSCSEGTATAVITAVGNGAMIPVVTKECGYDIGTSGYTIELSVKDILRQLNELDSIKTSQLNDLAVTAQLDAISRFTVDNFQIKMKDCLTKLIN